ncbi:DUF4926 domain-containing protein [uncultured Pontibacter sp.]|uniref:DUF4926 domain-containing protein n=1 Tax=uncultured Pontibacter sp. TaxID=453356 RepID=UPI00261FDB80|nr:DUF4926 domain-containing protein [uncultured Pontibacter sp.]
MIAAYSQVILTEAIPNTNLKQGDLGTVVEVYNNGEGYEIGFFDSNGNTIVVETLRAAQIREV